MGQTTLDYDDRIHPELAKEYMVVSQNHLATEAGYQILKQGGNAIDAAITAASVLAVVESHSTGVGGDLFCLYYPNNSKEIIAMNASGRAPAAVTLGKLESLGIKDNIPITKKAFFFIL